MNITGSQTVGTLAFVPAFSGSYTLSGGTITSAVIDMNANAEIDSTLGSTSVSISGAGVLTLGGNNLSSIGTLTVGSSSSLGAQVTLTNANSLGGPAYVYSKLELSGGIAVSGKALTMRTYSTSSSLSPYLISNGNNIWSGSNILLYSSTGAGYYFDSLSGMLTLSPSGWMQNANAARTLYFEGPGNGALTTGLPLLGNTGTSKVDSVNKSGTGTWIFSGLNTYGGTTTIAGGVLVANSAQALGTAGNIVFSGGTLQYTPLSAAAGATDYSLASRIAGSSAPIAIDTNGQTVTWNGSIPTSNTGGLTLDDSTGSGKLILAGYNFYTGGTTVTAGTLQIGNGGSIGSVNGSVTLATSGVLDLNGQSCTVSGLAGAGTITNSSTSSSTLDIGENNATGTFQGTITDNAAGGGSLGLQKVGNGILQLSASNNYSGGTGVSAGTLQLGNAAALGISSNSLYFYNGGVLDLNGFSPVVGTLSGSGTILCTAVSTVTLTTGFSGTAAFSGTMSNGSGTLGWDKQGSGTLLLGGPEAYTGPTIVAGGALLLGSGGSLGNTVVSVSSDATLGTAVSTSGGTVHVGGSLNLPASATLNLQDGFYKTLAIAGSGDLGSAGGTANLLFGLVTSGAIMHNDEVTFAGAVTGSGPLGFTFVTSSTSVIPGTYTLMKAAGGWLNNVAFSNSSGTFAGLHWSLGDDANDVYLHVYSGLATWSASGGGSWGTLSSAFGTNWSGGSPGIDANFPTTDTATFGAAVASGTAVVTLDGANPSLAALTFSNTAASYVMAAGSGGTLSLDATALGGGSGTASINVTGSHWILAPMSLNSTVAYSTSSSTDSLAISGDISGSGGLICNGPGSLALSGTNSFNGGTMLVGGKLILDGALSLMPGTSLTIGSNPTSPGAIVPRITPVPEPGALALLGAAAVFGIALRFCARPSRLRLPGGFGRFVKRPIYFDWIVPGHQPELPPGKRELMVSNIRQTIAINPHQSAAANTHRRRGAI